MEKTNAVYRLENMPGKFLVLSVMPKARLKKVYVSLGLANFSHTFPYKTWRTVYMTNRMLAREVIRIPESPFFDGRAYISL